MMPSDMGYSQIKAYIMSKFGLSEEAAGEYFLIDESNVSVGRLHDFMSDEVDFERYKSKVV